jgi:tellurite resistance protein TerC
MIKKVVHFTYKTGRRIVVAVVGASVLLLGIVMIVTPGPAFIVIPIGLAILALEFVWARHWLKKLREMISRRTAEHHAERAEGHRNH